MFAMLSSRFDDAKDVEKKKGFPGFQKKESQRQMRVVFVCIEHVHTVTHTQRGNELVCMRSSVLHHIFHV